MTAETLEHHMGNTLRKSPRQDRSRQTVALILKATESVLLEHGWNGASTNRVAERAGVSIGSVYQYFPNKNALVSTVAAKQLRRVSGEIEEAIQELFHLPPGEFIGRLSTRVVAAYHQDTPILMLMEELAGHVGYEHLRQEARVRNVVNLERYLLAHSDQLSVRNGRRVLVALTAGADAMIHDAGQSGSDGLNGIDSEIAAFASGCLGVAGDRPALKTSSFER